ncbi:MAG: hypothetical protein RQ866_07145, partial [Bacteroidales bacterium]|nr:hypothetical protein [Bacteroidales bacterium]
DADCKPAGKTWLNEMTAPFSSGADIILGYGDYAREGGIIGRLIRYDTFYIALQYLSFALAGIPYMGVGRNLAYKKELFFKAKGFIKHYHIASGDDDLFINSIARKKNVALVIHKEAHTISKPTSSLKKWCIQKRRHLSSGKEYRPLHKFLLGTLFFTQAVFFVLLIGLLSLNFFVILTLILFILRYFSQIIIFNLASKRLSLNKIFVLSFFTEAVMLCWYLLLSLSNLIRKPKRWN